MTGTLFLVPTPIGNLGDMTDRSREVLARADIIACEDTRNTKKLLTLLGVRYSGKLMAYHEYNADEMRPVLLEKLAQGLVIAQVSDAGTPLISDPGYRLCRDAVDKGLNVVPLTGANAVLPALQLSGLPSDRFLFNGFLPTKKSARQAELEILKNVPATLIFYESPHRVTDTLNDMLSVLGDRPAAVVRELTKKFEESKRGKLSDLLDFYKENGEPKGEIVIVVDRADLTAQKQDFDICALLKEAITKENSVRDAVDSVANFTGLDRRKIYKQALELKKNE